MLPSDKRQGPILKASRYEPAGQALRIFPWKDVISRFDRTARCDLSKLKGHIHVQLQSKHGSMTGNDIAGPHISH